MSSTFTQPDSLAMEKAKSPMATGWSKQIIAVGNKGGKSVFVEYAKP